MQAEIKPRKKHASFDYPKEIRSKWEPIYEKRQREQRLANFISVTNRIDKRIDLLMTIVK